MISCIFTDQFIQKTRNLQNYFIGPIPWKIKPASLLNWNSCSWIGTCRQSFNQFCLVLKKKKNTCIKHLCSSFLLTSCSLLYYLGEQHKKKLTSASVEVCSARVPSIVARANELKRNYQELLSKSAVCLMQQRISEILE